MDEGRRAVLGHLSAMVQRRMDTLDNLALSGLRGLTIINGGAIVAIFALLAQGSSSFAQRVDVASLVWAAGYFAAGLIAVMIANLLGYAGQQAHHLLEQEFLLHFAQEAIGAPQPRPDPGREAKGNRLVALAAGVSALSLVAFGAGSWCALSASLPAGAAKGPLTNALPAVTPKVSSERQRNGGSSPPP